MKIYFDGCSWTEGAELKHPQEERYSKLICDELGAEETNLGIGGGSNDRIVRNLLVENDIENYDLAIIQMTFPARTEYWDDKWIKVSAKHNYNKWLHGENGDIKRLDEKFTDHNQFWKYYYTNVGCEKYFDMKEKIQYKTIKNSCKIPLVICTINKWSKLEFDIKMDSFILKKHHYGHPTKEGHQFLADEILRLL